MKKSKKRIIGICSIVFIVILSILIYNNIKNRTILGSADYEQKNLKTNNYKQETAKTTIESENKTKANALSKYSQTAEQNEKEENKQTKNIATDNNSQENSNYVEGEAIVIIKPTQKTSIFSSIKNNITKNSVWDGITVYKEIDIENSKEERTYRIKSNDENNLKFLFVKSETLSTQEIIEKLKDEVYCVQPNYKYHLTSLTNDTLVKNQWAIENTGQFGGQEGSDINPISTNSDKEKVIAVLDSGIDYNNEDLKDVMWKDSEGNTGYDFVNDDSDPMDDYEIGHGTACAGIIAASSNNNMGVTGALLENNNIKIMNLKVADDEGTVYSSTVIEAYNYVLEQQKKGVNIVATNLSFGGEVDREDEATLELINKAGENGTLSICAAGNDAEDIDNKSLYPAGLNSDYIVSVTATNERDKLCKGFSNYGKEKVDLAAPGKNIFTTSLKNDVCSLAHTEEEMKEIADFYCGYDSKESLVKGEDYCDSTQDENGETINTNADLEITDENFFGAEGKSLKCTKKSMDTDDNITVIVPIKVEEPRRLYSNI